jgi:hypothetical protein
MCLLAVLRRLILLSASLLISASFAAAAQAQRDCRSPKPPQVGIGVGRSSPYVELERGLVDVPESASVLVRGGAQIVGRVELPMTGALRLRIESGAANWDVRQRTYATDGTVASDTSVGKSSARQLVSLVGFSTGRAPVCAHLFAGGGVYALAFRGTSTWQPGASLAAGIDVPTGEHGVIQIDAALNVIATGMEHPIASVTSVPVLNLIVGWSYRF